ncbi:hypothetical protein FKM82_029605 [Ascaphus truei]
MSEPRKGDAPPEPFNAMAYDAHLDPGTLSLSDSDLSLSDEAELGSLTPEEEDDEEEEEGRRDGGPKPPVLPFTLKGTSTNFSQRSQGIFECLKEVGTLVSPVQNRGRVKRPLPPRSPHEDTQETPSPLVGTPPGHRGKVQASSPHIGTAEPLLPNADTAATVSLHVGTAEIPVPAARLPDYLAHPERWTKYSLEDVPETTDRSNRSAALSFLGELRQRGEGTKAPANASALSYNQDPSSCGQGRILFTRPSKAGRGSNGKGGARPGLPQSVAEWGEEGQEESGVAGEGEEVGTVGFHGAKKRSRKNIRAKADPGGKEDSP